MWVHEVSLAVHGTNTVSIPVGGKPKVCVMRLDGRPQGTQVTGYGLGVDAAKARVHFSPDLVHSAPRAGQHVGDALSARSVHRVGHHSQFTGRDYVKIHHVAQVLVVGPGGVKTADQPLVQRCSVVHHIGPACCFLVALKVRFDAIRLLRQRCSAERRLELETVVARRVVARGDHYAGGRSLVDDSEGDGRAGSVGTGEVRDDAVASQDTRRLRRVPVGQKAGVETNHDFRLTALGFVQHVIGDRLGHQAQVGKREGIGDDRAPAVGAKLYRHGICPLCLTSWALVRLFRISLPYLSKSREIARPAVGYPARSSSTA